MPLSALSRLCLLAQALVVVLSLGLAELMVRSFGLERAAGALCLSSLATLVLIATALGIGRSARWQLKQPMYWLMIVNLCILIANSPLPANPSASDIALLAFALLASGSLATLLQSGLRPPFDKVSAQALFAVAHSWRRSAAHGVMLATATLVTTPIALVQHRHTSGLWWIITPLRVLQPFVRDSCTVALHRRSLGTLAGVLLVLLMAVTLPRSVPLDLVAIVTGVITVLVLFDSSRADLMLMADQRVFASALGITMALSLRTTSRLSSQ